MKIFIIISILLASCAPTMYCKVETTNTYTRQLDTIKIAAKRGICLTRYEGDTLWKLTDKKGKWVFKDTVSDFKVLSYSKKAF